MLGDFNCLDFLDAARFVADFNNGILFRLFDVQCWALWNSCSDLVYKGKSKVTSFIFAKAITSIDTFDAIHEDSTIPSIQDNTQWSPSRDRWVKLNSDASLSVLTNGAELCLVVRNSHGIVLSAHVIYLSTSL